MKNKNSNKDSNDILYSLPYAKSSSGFWILLFGLSGIMLFGVYAWIIQLKVGLGVTGLNNYVSWGLYLTNFIFFIGISHAGTLISAILRITNWEGRKPITRMAEAITVFSLLVGAPMIIADLGRSERVLNLLFFGRLQSPLLWDVISVSTYLLGSTLYLYLPMIPDLAFLRDRKDFSVWRRKIYKFLAMNWQGTLEQKRLLEKSIKIMAVVIVCVAPMVHTVVSWVYGMTLRAGWHSTIFGIYYVAGAIFSGTAAIITVMAIFRKVYKLQNIVTFEHFRFLGILMMVFNAIYIYLTVSEYLTIGYGGKTEDIYLLTMLFRGEYAGLFWLTMGFIIAPLIIMVWPHKTIASIVAASLLVNIGMWLKRFLITVPSLKTTFLPIEGLDIIQAAYYPTWVEWAITAAGFAALAWLFVLFSKFFPILSVWEIKQEETSPELVFEQAPKKRTLIQIPVMSTVILVTTVFLIFLIILQSVFFEDNSLAVMVTPYTKPILLLILIPPGIILSFYFKIFKNILKIRKNSPLS